ncbi:hypothetical protein [Blastopirellula retiformator]|uniref:Uncharacterized protein n=1 Tax=Blastopirellula retiformator TaxID=2527970 RepID=A0A5C5VKW3_9BACT|nr:hypothetical protein [Blastopirellula retiformator]TWT38643.1 hypothetical protein Enr8_03360 [Blastopirellula retiformator]
MLRGCVLAILLAAGLFCGYFYWLDQVFDWPANLVGAAFAGVVVFFCLNALNNAWTAWRDASRLGDIYHREPLIDGQVVAVSGTIHPIGDVVTAPFSGEQCVVCEYNLSGRYPEDEPDQPSTNSDFTGFLMVPCVIRGPRGDVRMFGFPLLEGFEEETLHRYDAAQNASNFLRATKFEALTGIKLINLFSALGEVWADEDGYVAKHINIGNLTADDLFPLDTEGNVQRTSLWDDERDEDKEPLEDDDPQRRVPHLKEKRVPIGADVCAIGRYDEMSRGLLPTPGAVTPNRLMQGTPADITAGSLGKMVRNVFGALVVLVITHAILFSVIRSQQDASEEPEPRETMSVEEATQSSDQPKAEATDDALLRNRDPAVEQQEPNGQPAEGDPGR